MHRSMYPDERASHHDRVICDIGENEGQSPRFETRIRHGQAAATSGLAETFEEHLAHPFCRIARRQHDQWVDLRDHGLVQVALRVVVAPPLQHSTKASRSPSCSPRAYAATEPAE